MHRSIGIFVQKRPCFLAVAVKTRDTEPHIGLEPRTSLWVKSETEGDSMRKRSLFEWTLFIGGAAMALAGLGTLGYIGFAIHAGLIELSTRAVDIVVPLDSAPLVFSMIVIMYLVAAGIFFWVALKCLR